MPRGFYNARLQQDPVAAGELGLMLLFYTAFYFFYLKHSYYVGTERATPPRGGRGFAPDGCTTAGVRGCCGAVGGSAAAGQGGGGWHRDADPPPLLDILWVVSAVERVPLTYHLSVLGPTTEHGHT